MVEIPAERRMRVLKLYFLGMPYDEIATKVGVAKGSVVNIIEELKKGFYPAFESFVDQVDQLRELATNLRKSGLGLSEASLGLSFFRRLCDLKVESQELERWIKLCRNLSSPDYPADKVVQACLRVVKLEEETGLGHEELEAETKRLRSEVGKLKDQRNSNMEARDRAKSERKAAEEELKRYLDEKQVTLERVDHVLSIQDKLAARGIGLNELDLLADWIEKCGKLGYNQQEIAELLALKGELKRAGVSFREVSKFIEDHLQLKKLGFGVGQAKVLAEEMIKMKLVPKEATKRLVRYSLQFGGLEQAMARVVGELKKGGGELQSLNRQIALKLEESARLDETIETKKDRSTSLGERCAELKEEIERNEREKAKIIGEVAHFLGVKDKAEEIQAAIEKLKNEQAEREETRRNLTRELESMRKIIDGSKDEIEATKAWRAFLLSSKPPYPSLLAKDLENLLLICRGKADYLKPYEGSISERVRELLVERYKEMVKGDLAPLSRWEQERLLNRVKELEGKTKEYSAVREDRDRLKKENGELMEKLSKLEKVAGEARQKSDEEAKKRRVAENGLKARESEVGELRAKLDKTSNELGLLKRFKAEFIDESPSLEEARKKFIENKEKEIERRVSSRLDSEFKRRVEEVATQKTRERANEALADLVRQGLAIPIRDVELNIECNCCSKGFPLKIGGEFFAKLLKHGYQGFSCPHCGMNWQATLEWLMGCLREKHEARGLSTQ